MTKRRAVNNIRKIMACATPDEFYSGSRWYRDALVTCKRLATQYDIPIANVVYTMAALSPNVRWGTNITALATLLDAFRKDEEVFEAQVVAGYPANVAKARRIIKGDLNALSGQKVLAFADNILFPEKIRKVTVDVHAYSIAFGKRVTIKEMPKISPKLYEIISAAYTKVGAEFLISPHKCQAITWTVWRRLIKEDGRGKRRSRL